MAEPELIHTGVGWRKVATSEASAETKASFTIPVIDLSDLGHSDIERRRDVAAQIYEACANVGFFYISNHGVSEELTTTAFSEAARFFDLPLEEKKSWTSTYMRSSGAMRLLTAGKLVKTIYP